MSIKSSPDEIKQYYDLEIKASLKINWNNFILLSFENIFGVSTILIILYIFMPFIFIKKYR
jgi:hypothetical protein